MRNMVKNNADGTGIIQGAKRSEQLKAITDAFEQYLKLEETPAYKGAPVMTNTIHLLKGYCEQLRIIADELEKS